MLHTTNRYFQKHLAEYPRARNLANARYVSQLEAAFAEYGAPKTYSDYPVLRLLFLSGRPGQPPNRVSSIVLDKIRGRAVSGRADHEFLLANRVSYVIDLNADHEIQRLRCLLHQAPLRVCRLLFLLLALLFRILTSARFLALLSSVRTDPSFHLCVRFFHLPKSLPVPGHLCRSPAKPVANQSFRPKLPIL
jgi:hypothetical protein